MKNKFTALVILTFFIGSSLSTAYSESWKKYIFTDLRFSVKCPTSWDVRELKEGQFKDMVTILLPTNTSRKKFRANMVIVSSVKEAASVSLEDMYRLNMDNMSSSPDFPDFELKNEYKIKLGPHDAYQTTFKYEHPKLGIKLKSFQIYSMTDSRMFVIQYAAPTATYKKYMDEVNEIVRTFEHI